MVDKSANDLAEGGHKIVSFTTINSLVSKTGPSPGNALTGNHWSVHDMSTVIS